MSSPEPSDRPVPEIEAVVYDFGGVLVDWDLRHLFAKLIADPDELDWFLSNVITPAENLRCDSGRPYAEMVAELTEAHPDYAEAIAASWERWTETIAGPIPGALELLDDLVARGHRLYGLSNWSAETFPLVRDHYRHFDRFTDIVISGEHGTAKPDRAIFDILCTRNGLSPSRSLFIDDNPANTAAATTYGFTTHTFTTTPTLRAHLHSLGLL